MMTTPKPMPSSMPKSVSFKSTATVGSATRGSQTYKTTSGTKPFSVPMSKSSTPKV